MERDLHQLEKDLKIKFYITEEGCNLINNAQSRITRERIVIRDEKEILIPGCNIYIVKNQAIDACVTKLDDEYYIFVNSGVIEEQRKYLEKLNWSFIPDVSQRAEYINDIIEYGFYFIVFHEYAHVYCGHVDACLDDSVDKKAQECEADMFAMDYLVKYIIHTQPSQSCIAELEKMFLAIYFQFENMQKERWQEWYNDKILENYYNPEKEDKRDHPLSAQRILYLYEMLNIVIVTDKTELLPIKEKILEKLKILKRLEGKEIPNREVEYNVARDSVQKLKMSVKEIREKIPRMSDVFEQ